MGDVLKFPNRAPSFSGTDDKPLPMARREKELVARVPRRLEMQEDFDEAVRLVVRELWKKAAGDNEKIAKKELLTMLLLALGRCVASLSGDLIKL